MWKKTTCKQTNSSINDSNYICSFILFKLKMSEYIKTILRVISNLTKVVFQFYYDLSTIVNKKR